MRKIVIIASILAIASCAPPAGPQPPPKEPWAAIALDHEPDYWVARQANTDVTTPVFIDAATIDSSQNIRRVAATAFMSVHPDTPWATVRLHYITEFDCAGSLVRPISTSVTSRGGPAVTNPEDATWMPLDQAENMQPMFEFACGSAEQRHSGFVQYTDDRSIEDAADAAIAAGPN